MDPERFVWLRGSQERTSKDPWFLVRLQKEVWKKNLKDRFGPHQSPRVVVRVLTPACLFALLCLL